MKSEWFIFIVVALAVAALLWIGLEHKGKSETLPTHLYKITTLQLWNASQKAKTLQLTTMDEEFIHLSEKHQVKKIIKKFFPDAQQVVVLTINPKQLPGRLVKERNPGGTNEYFHMYDGAIPMSAVVDVEIVKSTSGHPE